MLKKFLFSLSFFTLFIYACPQNNLPSPDPSVNLPSGNTLIKGEFYQIKFGPGSKGLDLGPGSKGIYFGPGSKGLSQLSFSFNIPEEMTNLENKDFSAKSAQEILPKVSTFEVSLVDKNKKTMATILFTPENFSSEKCNPEHNKNYCKYDLGILIEPDKYTIETKVTGTFSKLAMTGGQLNLENKPGKRSYSDIKLTLYRTEDNLLDIGVNTFSRLIDE